MKKEQWSYFGQAVMSIFAVLTALAIAGALNVLIFQSDFLFLKLMVVCFDIAVIGALIYIFNA